MPGQHYFYSYIGEDGDLLYVGQTMHLDARDKAHRAQKPWASLIARREVRGPMSHDSALQLECLYLRYGNPIFNIARRNGYTGPYSEAYEARCLDYAREDTEYWHYVFQVHEVWRRTEHFGCDNHVDCPAKLTIQRPYFDPDRWKSGERPDDQPPAPIRPAACSSIWEGNNVRLYERAAFAARAGA